MIRISLSYVFKISEWVHPLTQLQGEKKLADIFYFIVLAHVRLRELFTSSVYRFITCRQSAERLFELLENYMNSENEQLEAIISTSEIASLAQAAQAFEMALCDEFGAMPAYLVTPKGGYDVNVLTSLAEELFPLDLVKLIPETKYDIEQAAKCLAFEVPTAAGFHLHRINETVLYHYWDVVTKGAVHPKQRNMGVYLGELKKRKKGDAKTKAVLQQIKDLHRNPILHPEENLTLQEALELNGIIISAISRMLSVIRKERAAKEE